MTNLTGEIKFKTARSGGKGGQNVNKVETMVEGYWHVESSKLFTPEQKNVLLEKLAKKINSAGYLMIKSQASRTQLENKSAVVEKMNTLVNNALIIRKKRKPTSPGKAAKEKRLHSKKIIAEKKEGRKKITGDG